MKKLKNKQKEDELLSEASIKKNLINQRSLLSPEPELKHKICHICNINFSDFKAHIRCKSHKYYVEKDPLYLEID